MNDRANEDHHATETPRSSVSGQEAVRIRSLLDLIPESGDSLLDIGARDGHLASLLTGRFPRIVALDIVAPRVADPRIECVVGDATALPCDDTSFDTVVCAEVLEHISPPSLERACSEIVRVARRAIVIGVPYRQDLRCGETRCGVCGEINPPWGHQSRFDTPRLRDLFPDVRLATVAHVGTNRNVTNVLSARLMRLAGNPFGTYEQDEACIHCGARLVPPRARTMLQRVATRAAATLERMQRSVTPARASWIHVRFDKAAGPQGQPSA